MDVFRIEYEVFHNGDSVGKRVYYEGPIEEVPNELMEMDVRTAFMALANDVVIVLDLVDDTAIKDTVTHNYFYVGK